MVDDDPPPPPAPSRRRRIATYLFTRTLGLAVCLLALLALSVHLLDSGPGRRLVSDMIGSWEFANGLRVEVGRIEGSLYGEMVLRDLSVKDTRGELLWAPDVRVDWRPFAWLDDQVDVRSVTARRVVWRRLPALRETPASDAPLLPDLTIDIGALRIDRLIAEPAVSGVRREVRLTGSAHIADRRAQVRIDARTLGGGGNAGGDVAALLIDAVPEDNRLAIDLALDAPKGGLVAALAGLSEPLTARLRGGGDWRAWNGALVADLGGSELARLSLAARSGTFIVKGPARLSRLASGAAARLLGPQSAIDLTAALDRRRADLSGGLSGANGRVDASGLVDLGESRFEGLKLGILVARPEALAAGLGGRGLRADLTLDGAFAAPAIAYVLTAERLELGAAGIEALVARGAARVDGERIVIPVAARAARITGLDTIAGGALADVRLDGDLAISGTRLLSDNLRIRASRVDGTATLIADLARGTWAGDIDGRIGDYRVETVGLFDGDTDAKIESAPGGFALAGKVRVRSRRLDNAGLRDFLGGDLVASADTRYGPDGVIRLANLRAQASLVQITGGGGSIVPGGLISLSAQALTREYGPVAMELSGTFAQPRALVRAERPGFGIGLAGVEARVTGLADGYRFDLAGDTDYGPLTADVTFSPGAGGAVRIHRGELSRIGFAGELVRSKVGPFVGTLTAHGNGLDGVLRLGAAGDRQEVLANLRARGTVLPGKAGLTIGTAIVDARLVLHDTPHVVADVQVAGTHWRGVNWNAARVIIDYRGGRGQAKAVLEGTGAAPFRLAANATLTPQLWRVAASGRARGIAFSTKAPARIVPGQDGYELLPATLAIGGGELRLAGRFGDAVKLESRFENLDVALLNSLAPGYGIGGRASGTLDFAQAAAAAFPRVDARLTVRGFTRATAASISAPVDVNAVASLQPGGGEARAVFRQRGAVIGRMTATLGPLGASTADGWRARLLEAPLGGGVRYSGPAETLYSFAGQADQRLSGPIGLAADFSCRVSDPCLKGIVRGKGLVYENQRYGTRMTGIDLDGRFEGDRVQVDRLEAKAGAGTLTGKGWISLAAAACYPMDLTFRLDNARVARGDLLSARATGDLRLTKKAGEIAVLTGELRLPETRYKIVRQGAAEVPQLTGVRFARPRGPVRVSGDEPAPPAASLFDRVRVDIAVTAPERLYVTGMGLESEWRANFRVTGTSAQPEITGSVDLLRGTLGFAGRSFQLAEGRIGFPGGRVTNPTLAVIASDEVEDVTVTINVTGRAFNPRIAFASVPSLPQDEILARILFGDSIANLSAVQAVQLAASLNSLRASGGGLNPLGKLRAATGIDRLRILGPDEASGRGTALAAGQYITNDIYVELITDARGFAATQLEVSITPWLSLLSEAGGSGLNSASLRVKKNY